MTDNFSLTGKRAIVTGTSRGLGQYFARALARAGAREPLLQEQAGV
jgi:gluconate 5-dehydrogenase